MAESALEKANRARTIQEKERIFSDCFDRMEHDCKTTTREKELAAFIRKQHTEATEDETALRISLSVANAISHAVPGSMGVIVSQAALQAATGVTDEKALNRIFDIGHKSLYDSVNEGEKALNLFGSMIHFSSLGLKEQLFAQRCILETAAASVQGPAGSILAKVSLDMAGAEEKKSIPCLLATGLNLIKKDKNSTWQQKALAGMSEHFTNVTIPDDLRIKVLSAIAEKIRNPDEMAPETVIARLILDMSRDMKDSNSSDTLFYYATQAIAGYEGASKSHRFLAAFGKSILSISRGFGPDMRVRQQILEEISKPAPAFNEGAPMKCTLEALREEKDPQQLYNAHLNVLYFLGNSPAFNEKQKAIAEALLSMASGTSDKMKAAKVISDMTGELANPSAEPFPLSLAQSVADSLDAMECDYDSYAIEQCTFDALSNHLKCSDVQKSLVTFGYSLFNRSEYTQKDIARKLIEARKVIIKAIASPENGDNIAGFAGICVDVQKVLTDQRAREDALNRGYAILQKLNPDEKQKRLIKRGLEGASYESKLEAMKDLSEENYYREIWNPAPEGSAVLLEDDMVNIKGTRIKRQI